MNTMSKIKKNKVKRKDRRKYKGRSLKEIKELAIQVYRGDVFTSFQVHNQQDLGMVFMPLMMMSPVQKKDMVEDRPHMYYSYMKDRFPTGVNGYPCFGSVAHLNKEETEIFNVNDPEEEDRIINLNKDKN